MNERSSNGDNLLMSLFRPSAGQVEEVNAPTKGRPSVGRFGGVGRPAPSDGSEQSSNREERSRTWFGHRVRAMLSTSMGRRVRGGWWLALVPALMFGAMLLRSGAQDARPAADILAQLREIPVASLADAVDEIVGKRGFMSYDMRPAIKAPRIAGRAKTVLFGPLSENTKERALGPSYGVQLIDESGPGDVIVAVTNDLNIAALGGLMATTAKVRGLEGVVIDGAVRDVEQIEELGLAVFARSISPATMVGRGTSLARDVPVVCGGVTVYPGDYIVGDRDGVVCIPAGQVRAVLQRAQEMEAAEKQMIPMIRELKSLRTVIEKFKRI